MMRKTARDGGRIPAVYRADFAIAGSGLLPTVVVAFSASRAPCRRRRRRYKRGKQWLMLIYVCTAVLSCSR